MTFLVSVNGQAQIPFKTLDDAKMFAEDMENDGYECIVFEERPVKIGG
jgi:hypothetical protein